MGEELTDEARDKDEGCEAKHEISDKDFFAWFDGMNWIVRWKWNTDEPPKL